MSPFRGISEADLQARFSAIVAMLKAVMEKVLGPDRSNWGTKVVRVGNRDVRSLPKARLLEILADVAEDEDSVEVEYEFSNSRECYSEDGCDDAEQETSVNEGLEILSTVESSISSGEFQEILVEDSEEAGLTELTNATVEEVETEAPEVEIIEITPFPTPSTPSPTYSTCADSTLRFKVLQDNEYINRSCDWVARHPNAKCSLDGVKSHCPNTCWSCGTCQDSSLNFRFTYNGSTEYRSCSFIETDPGERCSIDGVSNTCRETCSICAVVTSPPTASPVATTTAPTTSAPTVCSDSPHRFKVVKDGKTIRRVCSWVANHPGAKCLLDGVSSHCPSTCGTCDTCADSSMQFRFVVGDNDKYRTCEWVARKSTKWRCAMDGIADSCRKTCGTCCGDSSDRFSFEYNGKRITRACVWAANKDTANRCAVSEVTANCPYTCGEC